MKRLHSIGFLCQIIWLAFFVGKVLKENDYDKVIFENSIPVLFSLKLYGNKKKYKDKYYIHMHSVPRKYYGNEKEFSSCKGLISVSNYVSREICADSRINISKKQIKIMYNCIDTEQFCPVSDQVKSQCLVKYGIDNQKSIILFAGRLCKEKGIEEVIKCFKHINNENRVLMIVGANFYSSGIVSPYEEYLKELTKDIKDKIIFTGYVDYSLMANIYSIADVVVLPSVWEEPAGMTIIEAMACRKPVITTVSGGIPEYTGHGNCILLQNDEHLVESLVENVKNILSDKVSADEIALKGYMRAIKYNKEFYYEQFLQILNEN